MMASTDSVISTVSPRVRDACESCHKRKIRCFLESGSPACQSCLTSGDSCLFAPRAKAGRPRRTYSENQRRKIPWDRRPSKLLNESRQFSSSANTLAAVESDKPYYDSTMPFDDLWDPHILNNMQELGNLDSLAQDTALQSIHEPQKEHAQKYQEGRRDPDILGVLTPSQSPVPYQYESSAPADESLDFNTALKLCGDLDRSHRALRDGQAEGADMANIMSMVEFGCSIARVAASSTSLGTASSALLLAAVYKMMEVCETLIGQIVNEGAHLSLLDRLFRLQRLDLALFQVFMFLSLAGHADPVKKVSELHTLIASIFQQPQYKSIW